MTLPLKEVRLSEGWTQEYVAFKVNVQRTYYTKVENQKANPGSKLREKLCRLFKKTHKELFGF